VNAEAKSVGCVCDYENDDPNPTGGSGGTAGSTSGKGGKGGTNNNNGGDPGTPDGGDPGTGATGGDGNPPATGDIDDVIAAICDWEFRCCDEGEVKYRLSPTITDAADCTAFFVDQLHNDNSRNNPYVAGNAAAGLLGLLGYQVDLTRVEVNAANVAACIEQWDDLDCNSEIDPNARCEAGAGENPCALTSLFNPTVELDGQCALQLAEGASGGNDVECMPGSTCIEGGTAENPNEFDACVKRGVDGEPCTNDNDCDFDFFCNSDGDCAEKAGPGDTCSFQDPDQPAAGEEDIQCKAGLTCHPVDFVCMEFCTEGFGCAADTQCPDGLSCAPTTVENDTTSFHLCRDLGEAATARCDTHDDCVAGRYCSAGGVCTADVAENDSCTVTAMCPAGMHCAPISATCVTDLMPAAVCSDILDGTDGCGPAPARCVAGTCSAGPVDNGDPCDEDLDCDSGLCDYATSAALGLTCIAGGGAGDDCDSLPPTGGTEPRCGAGFYCTTDLVCAAQVGPGGDCEDPDTNAANGAICANASCVDQWEATMCTDLAVPVSAGGTNVTCDGN
jgi:hypothetical protein